MIRILMLAGAVALALAPRGLAAQLFWNDAAGIHKQRLGDTTAADLFPTFDTGGIAVDSANGRLLWTDVLPLGGPLPGGVIRSASTQGGDVTDLVTHLTSPAGVAVEPDSGMIYWTDLGDAAHSSAVFRANADGSDVKELISADWLSQIAGIAIDSQRQQLYFTYIDPLIDSLFSGGVARADLDGSNLEPVVGGLIKPIGVAVDSQSETLFWADAGGLNGVDGAIEAADFDGQQRHTILGGLESPFGMALDPSARNVYWSDMAAGNIQRTDSSGILPYFEDVVSGLVGPTAIAVVPEPGAGTIAVFGALTFLGARRRRTGS